jgi:hypothetical protein
MGCSDRCPAKTFVSSASRIFRLLPSLGFDTISDLMAFVHPEYGTRGVVSTLCGAPVDSLVRQRMAAAQFAGVQAPVT